MTKNIYAFLVGIDKYHPASGITSLSGCLNDIDAVEAYLKERVALDGKWEIKTLILKNQDATREAIINGFQQHLCNAKSDDVALFYYAGHGSYETTPPEFWHIEQDRQHETIVCYDSRAENIPDLADKELGYLISKVARNNPHLMVIMDCCHSATGTRDPEVMVRQAPLNAKERTLDSFIFAQDQAALNELLNNNTTQHVEWLKAKHVALAACRADQVAEEYKDKEGKNRGVFSYFLLETLQKTNGNLTYQDLLRNVNALVNGKAQKGQSPQLEAVDKDDLNQLFLGGAISTHPPYFTLVFDKQKYNSWVIQGGAVHGITKPGAGGNTLLAIFPAGSTTESLGKLSNKLAVAQVTQVLPQRSKVQITEGSDKLYENETYWAVVTSLPIEPLKVYIQGDVSEEKGVELAIQALKTASFGEKPSLFVKLVEEALDAEYFLLTRNSQYWITQKDKRPLIAPVPEKPDQNGYTSERAKEAILRLESIARWNNILELESPATSNIKPQDVDMEIIVVEGKDSSSSISDKRLEYTYDESYWNEDTGEHWKPASLKIKLTNNSEKRLYCNVLVLSENYEVSLLFDEESSFQLAPKASEAGTTRSTDTFDISIPPEYVQQGITEYKDTFKLIVSTYEFDASLLKQKGFDPPSPSTRSVGSLGVLDSLMEQVNSRQVKKSSGGNNDDWMTKQVTLTYVHPLDNKPLKQGESTTLLDGVVVLQPHPSLQAKANLSNVPQITRDVSSPVLPPILAQDPTVSQPFQFTTSRGSDPGLSVLELTEVQNYASVTPETPLKLLVNQTLGENEHILPLGYDGEFYLPLGRGVKTEDGKTEIRLESLPNPTNSSRSLSGSIKILFQKLATQKFGSPFEYPILAIADVGIDGKLIANKENKKLDNVRAKVAQSKRILLYIHGIIGDTESLVGSVQKAKIGVKPIKELYDLVLTFDYENLNTTIQENAKLLSQRLEAVGLGANHGKELHIVAHSMGGLVSRWFIEREGGNKVVQHLVMLGTPNAGSPWGKVQDLTFALLSMGLNQLSTIVWPVKILAQLVELLEANDNSLEQMQINSDFLKEIAQNPDPHVPYTIIAGDRSLTSTALQTETKKQNIMQKLMQKISGKGVDSVVNLVFLKQPNDIAVTLDSIKSVNYSRSPQPKILPDVTCDHLSYFDHPAGLEVLAKALESIS